eukprot:1631414-Alexandrium_andersonii.AAC.1
MPAATCGFHTRASLSRTEGGMHPIHEARNSSRSPQVTMTVKINTALAGRPNGFSKRHARHP